MHSGYYWLPALHDDQIEPELNEDEEVCVSTFLHTLIVT